MDTIKGWFKENAEGVAGLLGAAATFASGVVLGLAIGGPEKVKELANNS